MLGMRSRPKRDRANFQTGKSIRPGPKSVTWKCNPVPEFWRFPADSG